MCCCARGFFGILAVIDPPVALESVAFGAAAHELPHAAGSRSRNCQRMKTGFGLGKIDELLGYSLLPQNAVDHVFVAAGAG